MSMTRAEAKALYEKNWDQQFTTMDALLARIKVLAENGGYSACVYIDSRADYDRVYGELSGMGFDVEHYNGGDNNILEITWG